MKEHGLHLVIEKGQPHELALEVYFWSMQYQDWTLLESAKIYETSTIRYLLFKYVSRVINSKTSEVQPVESLLSIPVVYINSIVDAIIGKSVFNDEDAFSELMKKASHYLHTKQGAYDYFLFLHGGYDLFRQSLSMNAYERSQLIAIMEEKAGINVAERFSYSIANETDLDLQTNDEVFHKNIKKMQRAKGKTGTFADVGRPPQSPTRLDPVTKTLIESSREAFSAELARYSNNKAVKRERFFNWHLESKEE